MMTPRKSAPIVKEPEIAARLRALIGEQSTRAVARKWRVNYRRLAVWLKGANAPEAENLRRIALATGVSVDWILGLPGAPQMRTKGEEGRSPESECAARLARAIAEHLHDEGVTPDSVSISLPELLDWIGETIARELRAKLADERRAMQTSEDAFAIEAMLSYLSERLDKPNKGDPLTKAEYRDAYREIQDRLGRIVAPHVRYRAPWLPGLTVTSGAERAIAQGVIVGSTAAGRLRALLSHMRGS